MSLLVAGGRFPLLAVLLALPLAAVLTHAAVIIRTPGHLPGGVLLPPSSQQRHGLPGLLEVGAAPVTITGIGIFGQPLSDVRIPFFVFSPTCGNRSAVDLSHIFVNCPSGSGLAR